MASPSPSGYMPVETSPVYSPPASPMSMSMSMPGSMQGIHNPEDVEDLGFFEKRLSGDRIWIGIENVVLLAVTMYALVQTIRYEETSFKTTAIIVCCIVFGWVAYTLFFKVFTPLKRNHLKLKAASGMKVA